MGNADNTLLEMQQQMRELREKLNSQKIVNEKILRNSMRGTTQRLHIRSRVPIFAGVGALACIPAFYELGFSTFFLIFTGAFMLICLVAAILTTQLIPRMDEDLVTAANKISRFHKTEANWIYFGIPALVVWLGLFFYDLWKNTEVFADRFPVPIVSGILVGILLGLLLGLKNRRNILDDADNLLKQLEELQQG